MISYDILLLIGVVGVSRNNTPKIESSVSHYLLNPASNHRVNVEYIYMDIHSTFYIESN